MRKMKFQELLFICMTLLIIGPSQSAEQCLDRFMDMSLVQLRASRIGQDRPAGIIQMDNEIRIMANIQFTCDTQIDSVLLGIDIRPLIPGGKDRRDKYPSIQLWRPTDEDEDELQLVSGSERTIQFSTPTTFSSTGVYQYPLTPPLNAIAGDRLAISQPKQDESIVRVYTVDVQSGSSYRATLEQTTLDVDELMQDNKLVLSYPITTSQPNCLITLPDTESYVREQSLLIAESKEVKDRRQFIYPDMKFMCNGKINKWIYAGTSEPSTQRIPELQVWRLSPGTTDTYIKIGASQVIVNETGMNSNIHELSVDPPIEFMEGDIFGLHQPDDKMTNILLHEQEKSGPVNLRFDPNGPGSDVNEALVTLDSSDGRLVEDNNNYPLVTMEISQEMTSTPTSSTSSSQSFSYAATTVSSTTTHTASVAPSTSRQVLSTTIVTVTHTISTTGNPLIPTLVDTPMPSSSTVISSTASTNSLSVANIRSQVTTATESSQRQRSTPAVFTLSSPSMALNTSVDVNLNDTSTAPITNDTPRFIGAMVAIGLLILTVIVCTLIVVAVLIWRRKSEKVDSESNIISSKLSGYDEEQTLSNPVYGSGDTSSIEKNRYKDLDILSAAQPSHGATGRSMIPPPIEDAEPSPANPIYSEVNEERRFQPSSFNQDTNSQHYEWNIVVPTLDERRRINNSFKDFREAVSSQYTSTESTQYDDTYQFLESVPGKFFEESNIYWAPGTDYGSLYEQLSSRKFREILSSHVSMSTLLGSGQFGVVMKGTWTSPDGVTPVAIKTVKQNAVEEEKVKFLQEAAIMGQFHHPNIIKIHGVVTMTEPTMIVLELMNDGDLHSYLKQLKPSPGEMVDHSIPELLLSFCHQVASAMDYLASKSFIHRDIAARNVLVTDKKTCKISDFGMSRDLQEENYYISKGGQIPIKWTAPEALSYKKYSTASDVWSYGVLMYEIWSLGSKPFQSFTNQQTFRKVCDGYRLPPPPGCPRPLYEMMMKCWNPEYAFRPSFCTLVADLSDNDHKLLEVCPPSNGNPQACVLGAPIEAGQELYPNLQALYRS